jgi:hypothetical protein
MDSCPGFKSMEDSKAVSPCLPLRGSSSATALQVVQVILSRFHHMTSPVACKCNAEHERSEHGRNPAVSLSCRVHPDDVVVGLLEAVSAE